MHSEWIEYFNRISQRYEQCLLEKMDYRAPRLIAEHVLKHFGSKNEAKVLDLACGTGLASLEFFELGFSVTGIDSSPGMIAVAKQRPFNRLICHDIEDAWPVLDSEYDIVVAVGLLEFVRDVQAFMHKIYCKLNVGGLCGITVPIKSAVTERINLIAHTPDDFRKMIDTNCFDILETFEFSGWETGHLAELEGHFGLPREVVGYVGFIMRRR